MKVCNLRCLCMPENLSSAPIAERREWWQRNCGSSRHRPEYLRCYFDAGRDASPEQLASWVKMQDSSA